MGTINFLHFYCRASCTLLCFFILVGCSKEEPRQWGVEEIITKRPRFNGGKLYLPPDTDITNLEIEFLRTPSGIRFYANLMSFTAPPWKEDPTRTTMTITFENEEQEPITVHPYILQGGQRLLFPGDVADTLVQALLDERPFQIKIGRSEINVVTTNFEKSYTKLLKILIQEEICPEIPFEEDFS